MVVLINYPAPTEGIHHEEPDVSAHFKDKNLGKGTLYISESVLCWINNSGQGFSLEYPSIYIHAISRDLSNFPEDCLYLMLDGKINQLTMHPDIEQPQELSSALNNLSVDEAQDEAVDEDDDEPTTEMRFVPDNRNMLDVMFRALSDCQALNPDPDDASDDGEAVIEPSFTIYEGNGFDLDLDEGNGETVGDEEMAEEQFEDAEQ